MLIIFLSAHHRLARAKAGIRVHFEAIETASYYQRWRGGEFEFTIGMMGPDWMDVDGVASFIAHLDSSYAGRVLLLEDLEINALVAAGKIENDPIEREKIYGELQTNLLNI